MATTTGDGARATGRVPGGAAGAGAGGPLVTRTLAVHAATLQRIALRHSLCADDAADAVQRGLELFLRHADRLDPERAHRWLFTVVKREAMAVRAERQRILPREPYDFDAVDRRTDPSLEDRVVAADGAARAAQALGQLKPAEAQALLLQAAGRSYDDIGRELGWTRTKVNRSLAEGRARMRGRMAGIEAGQECERLAPLLAELAAGRAEAADLAVARRHLRACPACRAEVRALHDARPRVPVLAPAALLLAVLQERALGAVTRGQAMAEALTTGKAAAVAASAAAIAGGGITAAERALEPPARATQEHVVRADRGGEPRGRGDGAARAPGPAPAAAPAAPAAARPPAAPAPRPAAPRPLAAEAPADPGTGPGTVAREGAPRDRRDAVAVGPSGAGPGVVEGPGDTLEGPGAVEPGPAAASTGRGAPSSVSAEPGSLP